MALSSTHDLKQVDRDNGVISPPTDIEQVPPDERQLLLRDAAQRHYAEKLHASAIAMAYQTSKRKHVAEVLTHHGIGFSSGGLVSALLQQGFSESELAASGLRNQRGGDMIPSGSYVYPHRNEQGLVCHFTFKNPDIKATWQPVSASRLAGIMFFGEHTLLREGAVALVEGENDFLSLIEAGWSGPVLASIGQISNSQLTWLGAKLADRTVTTFFDHDDAGGKYRMKVSKALPASTHFIVPEVGSDIDEYLKGGGLLADLTVPANEWRDGSVLPTAISPYTLAGEPATELASARLLVSRLDGRGRFIVENEAWAYCGPDNLWKFKQKGEVTRITKQLGQAWREIADQMSDAKSAARAERFADRCDSSAGVNAIMQLAQTEDGIESSCTDFDAKPFLLSVSNGVIDLRDMSFRPRQPEDLLSKSCAAAWDASAACPVWDQFLAEAGQQGSEEETYAFVEYLQKVAGACLLGRTLRRPFFFIYGPQGSGKSVFTTTLRNLLGDYSCGLSAKALMVSRNAGNDVLMPEIADLPGVRMCLIPEAGDENCFNDELLKAMTGGDPIKARTLNKCPIEFLCSAVLLFVGNSQPSSSTGGDAFMARIRVIGFAYSVPDSKRDDDLPERLRMESSGILNWMVRGAEKLLAEGWKEPGPVKAATERYRQSVDVFSIFLAENTLRSANTHVHKAELYRHYRDWAISNGFRPLKSSRFATRLQETGIVECRPGGGQRCWQGIEIVHERAVNGNVEVQTLPDYTL